MKFGHGLVRLDYPDATKSARQIDAALKRAAISGVIGSCPVLSRRSRRGGLPSLLRRLRLVLLSGEPLHV
jgi:hypothetical protein